MMTLDDDEELLDRWHAHIHVLTPAIISLWVIAILSGAIGAFIPEAWRPAGQWAVAFLAAVAILFLVIAPWLRWRARTCTMTQQRLIVSSGSLVASTFDVPWNAVTAVSWEQTWLDRRLDCGTAIFTIHGRQDVTVSHVPQLTDVRREVHELLSEVGYA